VQFYFIICYLSHNRVVYNLLVYEQMRPLVSYNRRMVRDLSFKGRRHQANHNWKVTQLKLKFPGLRLCV